ncbi:MAG TPA: acyltransferase [Acidimicrobiia bacterium]
MSDPVAVVGAAGVRDPDTTFPCFDGLRAIAAITVVLHHTSFYSADMVHGRLAPYFTHLDIGVAVFFLISGFLLYRPFVAAALADRPAPSLRRFFRRRLLRIYPAYWLALVCVIAFFGLPMPVPGVRSYLEYFTLTQVYDPARATGGLNQAWTLSIELSFYAFLPFYAWLLRRAIPATARRTRVQVEVAGLVVLYGISLAFRGLVFSLHSGRVHAVGIYWLPANLDYFALGMGLAVASVWLAGCESPPRIFEVAGRAPLVWWLLSIASFVTMAKGLRLPLGLQRVDGAKAYARQFLYGATAFFLLLPAVFGPQDRGLVRRFLRWKPMVYLGLISYGIYLWHQAWIERAFKWSGSPLFRVSFPALLTTAFAWTLITASLSWFLLERPLLRVRDRTRTAAPGTTAPAGAPS